MKAVVFDGEFRLVHDYPMPEPGPDEALIRPRLIGICNTDLEIGRGYAAFRGVPGHEFVGVVAEAKDADLVGRRVVGEINISCGECPTCRAGRPTHCPYRTVLGIHGHDGAMAEYLRLPVRNLHLVPENVPDEAAVFVEPLAAACQILDQVHVQPTDRVIVIGDGKLGLLIARVLALTGCDLLVVGHHRENLDILAARGIATRIGSEGLGPDADLVVECTGRAGGFEEARRLVRPRGTLVLKSTYVGQPTVNLSALVVDEITVVGSRCGPFPAALRLLKQQLVDVLPLIEAEYPLDEALAALEHAARRGARKVLLRVD